MPTLEEEYKQYQGAQGVNDMYEAQKKSQLAGLESAYQQNLSSAQAARDAIPRQYQERANDLAVQYERNRRNLNQQANANGLNTGAGSQMQLALGSNYQRDYGGIRTAQQQAIDQADRGIRDLQAAYNSSVQQAVADNDFQKTQALLADYQQRYQQQLQTAQNLAQYGDFSGYNGIPGYSADQIGGMQSVWAASNPDLAYRIGRITAEQYYQMTGMYPPGYQVPGAGAYYNDSPSSGPKNTKTGNGETSNEKVSTAQAAQNREANMAMDKAAGRGLDNADFERMMSIARNPAGNPEAVYNQLANSPQYKYLNNAQKGLLADALKKRMTGGSGNGTRP